jgi:hypothetical protein
MGLISDLINRNYFSCIACGKRNWHLEELEREGSRCRYCEITLRNRAQILGLMQGLRIKTCEFGNVEED